MPYYSPNLYADVVQSAKRLLDLIDGAYPCFRRYIDSWDAPRCYARCVKNNLESYADCLEAATAPLCRVGTVANFIQGLVGLFNRARLDHDVIVADSYSFTEGYVAASPDELVKKTKDLANKLNAKRAELDAAFQEYDRDRLSDVRDQLNSLVESLEKRRAA